MKIAIVVPSLALKAPVIVAFQLAQGFVMAGHTVTTFYFDPILELDFPCATKRISFFDYQELDGFDVVHTHCMRPDIYGWLCKKLSRNSGIFVSTIHNIVEEGLRFWYGKFYSAVFSRVWRTAWNGFDARVVLTDRALDYYNKTQPRVNFTRIYNGRSTHLVKGIDGGDEKIIREARDRWRIIGACAGLSRVKGLEQVVRALPSLPQYAFLVIGDGPAREDLLKLAQSLGVTERMISLGQKPNARDYLPYMDVYAMPSRSEGLPLALLEAVSAGVPVVCSNILQFREIFNEQEVAYFALDDIDGFVNAVKCTENKGKYLASRALRRFQSCYTQDVMVRNYLDYFEQLCSQAKKS